MRSVAMTLPGAALSVAAAIAARGGTRWVTALTVVTITVGCVWRTSVARAASVAIRVARISAAGPTLS